MSKPERQLGHALAAFTLLIGLSLMLVCGWCLWTQPLNREGVLLLAYGEWAGVIAVIIAIIIEMEFIHE